MWIHFQILIKITFTEITNCPWPKIRICRQNQIEQLEFFCYKLKFEVCKQIKLRPFLTAYKIYKVF